MLKIISLNLNGIRAAIRKGLFEWLDEQSADIICFQELKAQEADLTEHLMVLEGYHLSHHFAEKKGYSGVGLYSKIKPQKIITGLGWESADTEGRYVAMDFNGLMIASLYMPSGTSGPIRQAVKFDFLKRYANHLQKQLKDNISFIVCGDFNIAHKEIDLKNWRSNQKNSGFLPEERAWMDKILNDYGLVDTFRAINTLPEQYTWWSNRGRAWEKNVGWRIDYQVTTPDLKKTIQSADIFKNNRFSDHAPLTIQYDISL